MKVTKLNLEYDELHIKLKVCGVRVVLRDNAYLLYKVSWCRTSSHPIHASTHHPC